MAAKVGSRGKSGTSEDFEPFVVVKRADNKRVYLGEGVDKETAERLAEQMLTPCYAAPAGGFDTQGRLVGSIETD